VTYINISRTFYYLCSILDGCSRYIVTWDLRESMTEADIEVILERAKELHPEARPRIISDNGPQFIAKDFKEFIRISGMTHVRTSPRTVAQIAQRRVHPAGNATIAGRCAASGGGLRRALQHCPPKQRGWLHHPEGHARRASAGDPRGARPEVGGGPETAADSSRASCLMNRSRSVGPGECRGSISGLPTILDLPVQNRKEGSIQRQPLLIVGISRPS